MPELPEVETVVRGLTKTLSGRSVKRVKLNRPDLRFPFPRGLKSLKNIKIKSIYRRAKYILISLSNKKTMIVHLGMSGRILVTKDYHPAKHDHMILVLDNDTVFVFNDARRFGFVDLVNSSKLTQHRFFTYLGPEPFDQKFNAAYLAKKLKDKKTAIKTAIMDQRLVVGVGNIYASESLFDARLDPRRHAGSLSKTEIKKLLSAIRKTLKKAIVAGGSSLRDYVQSDGKLGYFQHQWKVYDKEGQKCPRRCGAKIKRLIQGGRSGFYCPACQK